MNFINLIRRHSQRRRNIKRIYHGGCCFF